MRKSIIQWLCEIVLTIFSFVLATFICYSIFEEISTLFIVFEIILIIVFLVISYFFAYLMLLKLKVDFTPLKITKKNFNNKLSYNYLVNRVYNSCVIDKENSNYYTKIISPSGLFEPFVHKFLVRFVLVDEENGVEALNKISGNLFDYFVIIFESYKDAKIFEKSCNRKNFLIVVATYENVFITLNLLTVKSSSTKIGFISKIFYKILKIDKDIVLNEGTKNVYTRVRLILGL